MKKFLRLQNGWGWILLLGIPVATQAITLTEHVCLTVPWGNAPAQVGHILPEKPGDEAATGPSGFAVNSQGRIGLIDIQNDRVQFWGSDQHLVQTISCTHFSRCPSSIATDGETLWYFSAGTSLFKLPYAADLPKNPRPFLNLALLGLQSPNEIETSPDHTFFVEDDRTFTTYQIAKTGSVTSTFRNDARWFALASQGFWTKNADIQKQYARIEDSEMLVLGTPVGTVFIIYYESSPSKTLHMDKWTSDGRKAFSITLAGLPAKLLSPSRWGEIRPVRMGTDGAIYAMDEPDADAFHIYRFDINP